MGNHYFQFKQFTVDQQHCAMKVCTDACLFGGWVAHFAGAPTWKHILDVGTGTGLLSLMLAQKTSAHITAIEIEDAAVQQATANFSASPWRNRLHIIHQDLRTYNPIQSFDLVMSNPPFFENDLHSQNQKRNIALHSSSLSSASLMERVAKLTGEQGKLALLLPYHRTDLFLQLALEHGLHVQYLCNVRQTEKHPFFRSMICFGRDQQKAVTEEITIKENGEYSSFFKQLLQEYYLHL